MKILSFVWLSTSPMGIAIVCIENDIGQRSVRVAPVDLREGQSEANKYAAEHGGKLNFEQSKGFFPELITEQNFKFFA